MDIPNIDANASTFAKGCWELRDDQGKLVARVGYRDNDDEVTVL